jgi:glycogen synthase
MSGSVKEADIIHCHTWYTHFAGCLLKQLLGAPLVLTTHSLEPSRPWKEEQLGTAYNASVWLEKTAYANADGVIAVSHSMKHDVSRLYDVPTEKIQVIPNGIDLDIYKPVDNPAIVASYGINPDKPFLLFVGRVTRQKGVMQLINAIPYLNAGIQVVLCAGAPDTEAIAREMQRALDNARTASQNEIILIPEFVPRERLIVLYSHASVFVCPSIYEPFGIINLEAMACCTPVVASAVGGIPEVVVHDETGLLVGFEPAGGDTAEPRDAQQFSRDLAAAVNRLMRAPEQLTAMGDKARRRVEQCFSWNHIAQQTMSFYEALLNSKRAQAAR